MAKRGLRKAERRRWGGRKQSAHRRGAGCPLGSPAGRAAGSMEEQEKSFSKQTRVLGHATPTQCLAMQDAEMETGPSGPGADAPIQGSPLGTS